MRSLGLCCFSSFDRLCYFSAEIHMRWCAKDVCWCFVTNKAFSSDAWHFHCIWLGLFLFRLVNLSEGNCLIWCLFHIFDSGPELRVGVPFYTLSQRQVEAVWNACHKNTFYINLRAPLVKTLAFMNHDRSLNGESAKNSSVWKTVSTSSGVGGLFSTALQNAACTHCGGNCSLFWLCSGTSVLLSVLQGQMPSNAPQRCRGEELVGHCEHKIHHCKEDGRLTFNSFFFQIYYYCLFQIISLNTPDYTLLLRIHLFRSFNVMLCWKVIKML